MVKFVNETSLPAYDADVHVTRVRFFYQGMHWHLFLQMAPITKLISRWFQRWANDGHW